MLREYLPGQVVDLSGCSLDAALYFVSRGVPVFAMKSADTAALIVGYDEFGNLILYDAVSGSIGKTALRTARPCLRRQATYLSATCRKEAEKLSGQNKKTKREGKNMDERIKTLAHNLVNYSCGVKEGDKVYVHYIGNDTEPLARAIIKEVYLAKGIPFVHNTEPRVQREVIMHCTEEQLRLMAKLDCEEMSQMDCYIAVRGTDNVSELSDVPAEKMNLYEKLYSTPVHHDIRVPKTRWVVLRYPNTAMAQLCNTSTEAFEDFYFNVCTLDYSKMAEAMKPLAALMERTDKVRLVGPGTDLTFSIKGIPAIPCAGNLNIPDGEVYTAPGEGFRQRPRFPIMHRPCIRALPLKTCA